MVSYGQPLTEHDQKSAAVAGGGGEKSEKLAIQEGWCFKKYLRREEFTVCSQNFARNCGIHICRQYMMSWLRQIQADMEAEKYEMEVGFSVRYYGDGNANVANFLFCYDLLW